MAIGPSAAAASSSAVTWWVAPATRATSASTGVVKRPRIPAPDEAPVVSPTSSPSK